MTTGLYLLIGLGVILVALGLAGSWFEGARIHIEDDEDGHDPSEHLVERVARAIREQSESIRNADISVARAAIAAMREPTSEMCAAGADSADDLSHMGAQTVWHAMCDAALSEQSSR